MMSQVSVTRSNMGFMDKPVLVFWETTRACMLACKHCRASAIRTALPNELTKKEGFRLLDSVRSFGDPSPVVILTGGDPLMRDDIFDLIGYANAIGVRVALSPAVTEKLTHEMLVKIKESGVASISVSLDGSSKETHDAIRSVDGTFDRTIGVMKDAIGIGLSIQVNTTVMKKNIGELPKIFHLIKGIGIKTWEVFFLIRTGRGAELQDISPEEYESVCNLIYDASMYGVIVRVVEGPFIRRVAKTRREAVSYWKNSRYLKLKSELLELEGGPTSESTIASRGTLDGDGILFVSYEGTIYPGGFVPVPIGNVRNDNLVTVYRENKLLKDIRARRMTGFCGTCGVKETCGGSRARAYAHNNDPLSSDPACIASLG
jgi:radical SAM protein